MAFVGPLVSLLIGAFCYGLLFLVRGIQSPVVPILSYLAFTNILLGVFNLIPGLPLDGGRILRSIIWKVTGNMSLATNVATMVGQVFAYLFIFFGIVQFFAGNGLNGLFIVFTGWFLLNAAHAARNQATLDTTFEGVLVSQVMTTSVVTTPANISLQKLVDEYLLPQGLRSAFVTQGDQLAGLITLSDVRHVPGEQWRQTPVGLAMVPLERPPHQSLKEVLTLMNGENVNQCPFCWMENWSVC